MVEDIEFKVYSSYDLLHLLDHYLQCGERKINDEIIGRQGSKVSWDDEGNCSFNHDAAYDQFYVPEIRSRNCVYDYSIFYNIKEVYLNLSTHNIKTKIHNDYKSIKQILNENNENNRNIRNNQVKSIMFYAETVNGKYDCIWQDGNMVN